MVVQISVAVIAVAFAILVYYVIQMLRSAKESLDKTNILLLDVRNDLEGISRETTALLQSTHEITQDIQSKLKSVDPLMAAVHETGEALRLLTSSAVQAASTVSNTAKSAALSLEKHRTGLSEITELAAAGANLWLRYRERSKKKDSIN